MLRRDRQIRTQTSQLADACLVALSFWLAYLLRSNPAITEWLNLGKIPEDAFNNINQSLLVSKGDGRAVTRRALFKRHP